ncbi:MAG: hypothetical protein GC179_08965 [Anaerolineaceae bacterium]|nr:hypothetical protein [Anaerolineaceae bacterium]
MHGLEQKMAPWIAHLRVAETLLKSMPHLDETAFAYGNLAPDSGKPNADWTSYDPPKEVTHFLRRGDGEDKIHDLKYYRGYLADIRPEDDLADYSFRLGYFAHLLSDSLWSRRLNITYKQLYPELVDNPTHTLWRTLKRDWFDLDFCYLRDNHDCLFWRIIMTTPNPPPYLPFVSHDGLTHSLDHIRHFYSTSQPDIDHPYLYLNQAMMSRYIEDTAALIIKLIDLLQANPPLHSLNSSIRLLKVSDYAPYEPPFGDRS